MSDDPRTLLKRADGLLASGNAASAVALYKLVAQTYAAEGFALKAVALYKQVRTIAGYERDLEARAQLITLHRSLGLTADAEKIERE